jgi:3-oxoacyl-[acyl-carrier protein] reductase
MQLEGKLVAITGSGRGIGRAMALAFAQKRANLALIDLNPDDLSQTRGLCEAAGVRAATYVCNVTREDVDGSMARGDRCESHRRVPWRS